MTEPSNQNEEKSINPQGETANIWTERIKTRENGKQLQSLAECEIEHICGELELNDGVCNVAKAIYSRALDTPIIENRTLSVLTSAAVYCAVRVEKEPISLQDVCELSNADQKILNRTYTELSSELGLKTGPADPDKFVRGICDELELSIEVEDKAKEILEIVVEKQVHIGKNPKGVAACAVYMSSLLCNERRTQLEVANAAGITVRTLRSGYREQFVEMDIDTDEGS